MKTVKELKEELQSVKKFRRKVYWGHGIFIHGPSIYLTRLLITTPITANQVTFIMILLGIIGSLLLIPASPWFKMAGFIIMYASIVFDGSDGEVARYRKTKSMKGIYLDDINHLLVPGLFMICMGVGVSWSATTLNPILIILIATFGGLSWSVIKAAGKEEYYLFARHYLKAPEDFPAPDSRAPTGDAAISEAADKLGIIKKILKIRYQLRQFLMAFLLFVVAFILDVSVLEGYQATSYLVIFYGAFLTLQLIENIIRSYLRIEGDVTKYSLVYNISKKEDR